MSYREIPEDRVLEFPATPGFKEWEPFFTEESTTHPAKMNLNLLKWILETYTKPGEVILDPMAGTGSTIILASILGRHGVAVEYESRFYDMIRANIGLTERQTTLIPKGRMICIQGDARELSKLLKESDTIITSPPYASESTASKSTTWRESKKFKVGHDVEETYSDEDYRFKENREKGNIGKTSLFRRVPCPPEEATFHDKRLERKGTKWEWQKEVKIDVDAVITSPPYSSQWGVADENRPEATFEREKRHRERHPELKGKRPPLPGAYSTSMNNIGNLPHGDIDAVVTSPPYSEGTGHGGGPASEKLTLEKKLHLTGSEAYSKPLDAVVTSPPYEGSRAFHDIDFMKSIVHEQNIKAKKGETKAHYRTDEAELRYLNKINEVEYEQPENIGNLKSDNYLGAMLQVYRECWKVLKNQGKLIVVVKNFIRDKAVVRLDLDTIKLCEAAGFHLADRWYFKLPTRSFWRILYKKRFPDVPEVEFEDVLVFSKEVDIPGGKVK